MRHALRFRSTLPHWLVIWTILLAALLPAVAPWVARAQVRHTLPSSEVCSAAPHGSPASYKKHSEPGSAGQHCALCVHETHLAGLPPQDGLTAPLRLDLIQTAPQGLYADTPAPTDWSRPHTRAPPVSLA